MPSRRKELDTALFRAPTQTEGMPATSPDMSPVPPAGGRKRASFDIRPDQISELGQLKYRTGKKISDLVVEALDDLIAKYER